ncbi:hypothetical protein [Kingella oralis]|uniref:hypothetical protein n=1 Tax=Kingella oralis TaxID=505 RepID=UPI003C6FE49A
MEQRRLAAKMLNKTSRANHSTIYFSGCPSPRQPETNRRVCSFAAHAVKGSLKTA